MAAQFDTYLAQYQHGLCFSFMRGVSFTEQPKNFPSEIAVGGERHTRIKNYAIQSSHVQQRTLETPSILWESK
jgi:hypothetical protein